MKLDSVIDRFVARVNGRRHEPMSAAEVPPSLRLREVEPGYFEWRVHSCASTPWVSTFEARLPSRLPRSFESLVRRYCFPPLEVGSVMLYANTSEGVALDLRNAALADPGLSAVLLSRGLLPFARSADGSYDPICFLVNRGREYPVVRIDHESVLLRSEPKVSAPLARSFLQLIEEDAA